MIESIVRWFVEPSATPISVAEPSAPESVRGGPAATLGVVCTPRDGPAAGAALALALRRANSARCALVAEWCCGGPGLHVAVPATAAARRLAAVLAARGLGDVGAAGHLVRLRLPPTDTEAAAVARRALAVAGDVPSVLVAAGPRTGVVDALLGERDRVVVVESGVDPELADLALASLPAGVIAIACRLEPSLAARALAVAGSAVTPSLRASLRPAIADRA